MNCCESWRRKEKRSARQGNWPAALPKCEAEEDWDGEILRA
jgi:hypothetical protein